jgi:hypothetical protein
MSILGLGCDVEMNPADEPVGSRAWKERKGPMKYMLLIYEDEQQAAAMTEQERAAQLRGHYAFLGELTMFGKHVYSEGLEPSLTSTVVRVQDGTLLTTDGPYIESKEMVAGFYVIAADDLDEAITWATKLSDAGRGAVEIRPIYDFTAMRP